MAEHGHLLVLGFPEYGEQSNRLAEALNCTCNIVDIHRFPDGETRVRLPEKLPSHVVICRSLNQPNDKLVELMLTAATARELGARRLILVAPYLCYMRQDKAFVPGEGVSQVIIGRWLASLFERVVTVDPHLHRTTSLDAVMPGTEAVSLTASFLMGAYLRDLPETPFLIGPDEEARQWVAQLAELVNTEFALASKRREGDRDVSVSLRDIDCQGRRVVVVDDIVSTGETVAAAARLARAGGAAEVQCLVTHALFCEGALEVLRTAGVGEIVSSDSITHSSNHIHLAPILSEAVRGIVRRTSGN